MGQRYNLILIVQTFSKKFFNYFSNLLKIKEKKTAANRSLAQ
jgi:hypothetical protein